MLAEVPVQYRERFLFCAKGRVQGLRDDECSESDRVRLRCACGSHVCTNVNGWRGKTESCSEF